MDDRQRLLDAIAALEAENADLRRRLGQMEHELQRILQLGKRTRGAGHRASRIGSVGVTY